MSRKRQQRKARQRAREVEEANRDEEQINPAMQEVELRRANVAIDVPFEAPPARGGPVIRYKDGSTLEDRHRKDFPDFYADEDAAEGTD